MPASLTAAASDRRRRALLAVPAGAFAASLGLGKIVRDCSLTCNVGFRLAPVAILAIAILSLPLAALAVRAERRWGYERWQVGSLVLGAASLIAFRLLAYGLLQRQDEAFRAAAPAGAWVHALRWTYLAFYVWVGALAALLGVNVYSHLLRLFAPAERAGGVVVLAPAFAVGGFVASFASAQTAPWLMTALGWRYELVRDNLMLAMAVCLLLQIPFVRAIARRPPASGPASSPDPSRSAGTIAAALGHRLVGPLFAVIALGGVADTALKYLFYWLVTVQVDSNHGRTLYFAAFYAWLNGVNLILLALGTNRAIRRLGFALSLAALPIAMIAGVAALAVRLAMTLMYGVRVADNSLRSVLYEPTLDRAFARVPRDLADRGRALLKGVAPRGGEGLGAGILLGLSARPWFDLKAGVVVLLLVVLAWLGSVLALGPALREAVGEGA